LYHAVNFTSAQTKGGDISIEWVKGNDSHGEQGPGLKRILVQYTFLDSRIDRGKIFNSKYTLTHPKHHALLHISAQGPFSTSAHLSATHKIKPAGKGYTLVDLRLSKDVSSVNLSIKASNLLNTPYEEIRGVPLPGRWIIGEVGLNF